MRPERWLRDAGALLSVVAGFAALVELIASGWSSIPDVLYWAGWAYVALVALCGGLILILRGRLRMYARWKGLACLAAAAGMIVAADRWEWFLPAIGIFGISTFSYVALETYVEWRRSAAKANKQCPECDETIKAAAKKCRHCGYRYPEPAPP